MRTLQLPILVLAIVTAAICGAAEPRISLESPSRIVVSGLSSESLHSVKADSLRVFVAAAIDNPPLLGATRVEGDTLVFRPRFPLRTSIEYQAVFEPLSLQATLSLPSSENHTATELTAIYPSADILPENQLKFYLHFSAPMSRGDSYRHVTLLDDKNEPVQLPFVEIGEELWDNQQQRLTLLLDPGRIKRGLKPNEEVGPPLVAGHSYTFLVSKDWLDAERRPLAKEYRKPFRVGPFDSVQPDPAKWQIKASAEGTQSPLKIQLDEPLDHSLLLRCLTVTDSDGNAIAGEMNTAEYEAVWQFRPESPWGEGSYAILVDTKLEDLAGNSIQRPFEVNRATAEPQKSAPAQLKLPFEIR